MRRVLATDFGIWPMLQHLERASDQMILSKEYWAQLANYLILYDQLVIPTGKEIYRFSRCFALCLARPHLTNLSRQRALFWPDLINGLGTLETERA